MTTGRQRLTEQQQQEAEALGAVIRAKLNHGDRTKLATAAGVDRSTVRYWLKGTHRIPDDALAAIAAFLKTTPDALRKEAAATAADAATPPRPVDTPHNGVSSLPGSSLEGAGTSGGAGRDARASSPVGALRPSLVRIYREGVQTDPFRPGDGTRDTDEERPLAFGHERDFVGSDGFGVELGNATLANWEAGEGRPLRTGWIVWCNPIGHKGVVDGHLVVVVHPRLGLRAGVYREDESGSFLETDDPLLLQQEREPVELEWVAGPVVYATTGGAPQRRANRRPADGANPAGPSFLTDRRGQPNPG